MENDILIDADVIEQHYKSLILGTEQCSDPIVVIYDEETNLSVRDNSKNAYERAVNMEKLMQECVNLDAEHLKKIGETFFSVDADLASDINDLRYFE